MRRDFVANAKLTASMLIALAVFALLLLSPTLVSAQPSGPYVLPQHEEAAAQANPNTQQSVGDTSAQTQSPLVNGQPDIQDSLCAGVSLSTNGGGCGENTNEEGQKPDQVLNQLVADIINLFSWVVGIVAVIMIIVGGFQYITSGGDSTKVGTAKNTIMYALIGLVIVALSQSIVRFVLGRVIT